MAALAACLCPVGYLVMPVAAGCQQVFGEFILLGGEVGFYIRQRAILHGLPHGSSLLKGKRVERDVWRSQRQCLIQRIPPAGQGLTGQAVDKVYANIVEPRAPGKAYSLPCLCRRMSAPQQAQVTFVQALDTQAQTVDTEFPYGGQVCFAYGARVGLHGYFSCLNHRERILDGGEYVGNLIHCQQAGCAPTEIDAAEPLVSCTLSYLCFESTQIGLDIALAIRVGNEGAITALAVAEWCVDIECRVSRHRSSLAEVLSHLQKPRTETPTDIPAQSATPGAIRGWLKRRRPATR